MVKVLYVPATELARVQQDFAKAPPHAPDDPAVQDDVDDRRDFVVTLRARFTPDGAEEDVEVTVCGKKPGPLTPGDFEPVPPGTTTIEMRRRVWCIAWPGRLMLCPISDFNLCKKCVDGVIPVEIKIVT